MKTVRAKFDCVSIHKYSNSKDVHFLASTSNEGNEDFSKFTPSGELKINITNDAPAYDSFEIGKTYFLNFTEA